jgi:hypothetical protein
MMLDTAQGGGQEAYVLLPEESEDPGAGFLSEYEKVHPLVMPKGLTQVSAGELLPGEPVAACPENKCSSPLWPPRMLVEEVRTVVATCLKAN